MKTIARPLALLALGLGLAIVSIVGLANQASATQIRPQCGWAVVDGMPVKVCPVRKAYPTPTNPWTRLPRWPR